MVDCTRCTSIGDAHPVKIMVGKTLFWHGALCDNCLAGLKDDLDYDTIMADHY